MSYTTNGLATALIQRRWYYIRPNGDRLQVVTFDNGADYFSEGLTRSFVRGKIGSFDSEFHQVIPPKHDWGWPIEAGRALVCIGCKPSKADDDGHSVLKQVHGETNGDRDTMPKVAPRCYLSVILACK